MENKLNLLDDLYAALEEAKKEAKKVEEDDSWKKYFDCDLTAEEEILVDKKYWQWQEKLTASKARVKQIQALINREINKQS